MSGRRGTILIIVAGVAALLASLAFAFLLNMRRDGEESAQVGRETQARIMLMAACHYIQEASRLGWDDPSTAAHEEAFGWIDVRDGNLGPKIAPGPDDDSRFPIGRAARFPMNALKRPPYAIKLTAAPNAIVQDTTSAAFGWPLLMCPDPMPVVDNGWTWIPGAGVNAAKYQDFVRGDLTPVAASQGKSWFRVYRQDGDTFVATCGAGASLGFKDWAEVVASGQTAVFFDDKSHFDNIVSQEIRLFYLVQWSPAVATSELHNPHPCLGTSFMASGKYEHDQFVSCPMNTSHSKYSSPAMVTQGHAQNPVGTIRWIQRLQIAPTNY